MKQLELTPRLQAVADMVPCGAAIADIGTDHAYLPVALLLRGQICSAIAADISAGPLSRAKKTAEEYECREQVAFRLCDGLSGIQPDEADTIIIAGMGGQTIVDILEAAPWLCDKRYTLLLQPMSTQPDLRRWLWQNGFSIQEERIICEADRLYIALRASFGDAFPMSRGEEWAGRQYRGMIQPLRGEYLRKLKEKIGRAADGISRGKSDSGRLQLLRAICGELEDMEREWNEWQS